MAKKPSLREKFRVLSKLEHPTEVCDLRAETKLWFDAPPYEFPGEYVAAFTMLVAPIKERLNFYRTENMSDWKKPSAQTLAAPKLWVTRVKDDAARSLFVRESFRTNDAAKCGVETDFQGPRAQFLGSNADFLRQVLPVDWLDARPEEFLKQALELADRMPFLCGHVGYSLELSPLLGSSLETEGQQAAYGLGTRHPGALIGGNMSTKRLRLFKGVEGVSWLTLVGKAPLDALGGSSAVVHALEPVPEVIVHPVANGLVIQAGPRPLLGDVNRGDDLPLYRAVYAALSAMIEPELQYVRALRLRTNDDHERTMQWFRRFGS